MSYKFCNPTEILGKIGKNINSYSTLKDIILNSLASSQNNLEICRHYGRKLSKILLWMAGLRKCKTKSTEPTQIETQ